jgi:hypothetical protein
VGSQIGRRYAAADGVIDRRPVGFEPFSLLNSKISIADSSSGETEVTVPVSAKDIGPRGGYHLFFHKGLGARHVGRERGISTPADK